MHDTQIPEELDIIVLTLQALDGHMPLFTPAQKEKVLPYMRGLATYEASRPTSKRPASNVVDFEAAIVKSRLEKSIRRTRAAQLADAYAIYQHGVNEFGDLLNLEEYQDGEWWPQALEQRELDNAKAEASLPSGNPKGR